MAWLWTTLAVFAALSLIHGLVKRMKGKKLPPGPRGLPIVGHLHLLGKNPHQDLSKLDKQYGPIMHLRLGFVDTIVASSPHAAQLFLKTHDLVFASRPPIEAAKYMSYNQKSLSFGEYGPYWRDMRKLCTLQILSNHKVISFQAMRREELCYLIDSLKQSALNRVAVDLSAKVSELSAEMSCRMVVGKKYENKDIDERGFKAVIHERILDDHEQIGSSDQMTKDFVDIISSIMKSGETEFQFTLEHVKAILMDMLAGSIDTTSCAIDWIMVELLRNPQVLKKVQQELESKVGLYRMVDESDLDDLNYLEMVMKESFRLHPPGPLLIPHEAREDSTIDGFHIPKKARIIVNAWSIGRDPNVWVEPEKFMPERFEGCNIDYRGRNFEFIPFSSGRRSCPGLQLAITMVKMVVAQLVHCFDWELSNGMSPEKLDMTEEFGLVMPRAKHLIAVPHYRLHI
nr:cytochrome P450 CYP736A12-like [Ipomoea batatas]